jgi:hypothetical protein
MDSVFHNQSIQKRAEGYACPTVSDWPGNAKCAPLLLIPGGNSLNALADRRVG